MTSKTHSRSSLLLLAFGLTVLGCVSGVLFSLAQTPPDLPWEQWATPPEQVRQIESMYMGNVYLVAVTGTRYVCSRYECHSITAEQVRQLPDQCASHLFEPPATPGSASATLELCYKYEAPIQMNVTALLDGSLWTWSKAASPWGDRLDEILYGLVFGGVGLILGIILALLTHQRAKLSTTSGT